jgi:uracil-DNA glycosylase family 4
VHDSLETLEHDIVACELCPRLRAHCLEIARVKRRAYADWEYWGKPVPGFGDPAARLYVLGLAPGAHGANRTGRVFTGDSSGDWLYRAMYETGFANQPASTRIGDGLQLRGAWVGAAARCAPPDNKPAPEEFAACRPYARRELQLLRDLRVVIVLGRLAHGNYLSLLTPRPAGGECAFYHGAEHHPRPALPTLLCSYHPSRQNTQTGRLTAVMLRAVFERARQLCGY